MQESSFITREVFCKLFGLNFTNIGNTNQNIKKVDSPNTHPNLVPVLALLESDDAFYVVQPYSSYSLWDCITFSPAILSSSFAKPLFILYQLLHAILYCHNNGVPVGDLRAQQVTIDNQLWVQITQPDVTSLSTPLSADQKQSNYVNFSHDGANLESLNYDGECTHLEPDKKLSLSMHKDVDLGVKGNLLTLLQKWMNHELNNFSYLMALNELAGRRVGDPNHHPVLPWVMDFTQPDGGYRDLTRSKFRLNKGDCQLDLTFDTSIAGTNGDPLNIPHHISDVLSDITYYVYTARRTPKSVLCTHVRPKWVPGEYPASMVRLHNWTPDECIPEFFTDPNIFTSIHEDLPNLELPHWCDGAEDFIRRHMATLESDVVSQNLHHWIDLTFGYKVCTNYQFNV